MNRPSLRHSLRAMAGRMSAPASFPLDHSDHLHIEKMNKALLRNFVGELPLAAELDWALRQKNRVRNDHFSLERLKRSLPEAVKVAESFAGSAKPGRKILFFATLHYWIDQSAYISLALAGLGHKVTLMTLPYSEWHKRMDNFTQRQRILHTRDALKPIESLVKHVSLLELKPDSAIPE